MSFTATAEQPDVRDVEALDAGQWHEALKALAGTDAGEAMARDAVRRSRAGLLTVRDMRLVLLATGDAAHWAPAREAVMTVLAGNLEKARQVLASHTNVEVWPAPRFEETTLAPDGTGPQVTAAAVVGPSGAQVTGPAQSAPTRREAQDRAALALLARLAGVALPGTAPDPAASARLVLPGMPAEVFEQRLRRATAEGCGPDAELEEEALSRARAGRLRPRELYLLLLAADGEAWADVRQTALQRAAAMPPAPARLLHWYAEQHGEDHGLTYQEKAVDGQGRYHLRAQLSTGAEPTAGPVRSAFTRKTARHYAACALLAQLAALPEPTDQVEDKPAALPAKILVPGQDQDPVKHLNKHHQLQNITKPESRVHTVGESTEVTYTCRHRVTGTRVEARAADRDKIVARQAAALELLRKL
ncbi:hypothetical protein ACFU99_28560, partial [Streptomyces sp. NPDC057654]|uniref:hypothetical protein n=1 Tax=Streptomyces sp. NPDC057654 TaxID=3346196 RepID=UPI003693BFA3